MSCPAGAVVMGCGPMLQEQVIVDSTTDRLLHALLRLGVLMVIIKITMWFVLHAR